MRRSGTIARQVLWVRAGRHDGGLRAGADRPLIERRFPKRRYPRYDAEVEAIVPVSPAVVPAPLADEVAAIVPISPAVVPALPVDEVAAMVPVSPAVVPAPPADGVAAIATPLLPGARTAARRMKFVLVNGCTLASLILGMLAIFLAMQGEVRPAALCLIACVACDGLDGALARRLGVASPFGAQMDSLADMCSFGLAAPVVVYASLAGSVPPAAAAVACALVASCAAIRLARFNVSPKDGRFFCGVPTTMAAAMLALTVAIGLPVSGLVLLGGVALLAFAMVSSFPYAKLARLVKLPPWVWLAPVVGALVDIRLTFALVVAGYLLSGPVLWLRQRRTI